MAPVSLCGTEFLYQDPESKTRGFMRQAQIFSRTILMEFKAGENTAEKQNSMTLSGEKDI